MKKLLTPGGIKILESLSFTPTLYAFDFDGTLSKIVRDPSAASIRSATDKLLRELASHAEVAVISGRSIQDLKKHLKFTPRYLIGNHGLEGLGTQTNALEKARAACATWKRHLLDFEFDPAVEIEDKAYSLAIHYRKCSGKKKAKASILAATSQLSPAPRIILGKCVVNIVPPGAPHKGTALEELMRQTGITSAFYIGDDDTDEDIFSLPNARILSVRVGNKLNSEAQYYLQVQSDIDKMLRTIVGFYRETK